MVREYFPKYSEVSKDVYEQVKGIMKGYDRLKRERLDILYGNGKPEDGMPGNREPGRPTEQKAIKLAYIDDRLEAIDQAAVVLRGWLGEKVPAEFDPIKAFWSYNYFNYMYERTAKKPDGPCRRTWNNYRYRFAAAVAERLNIF